jgi:hypothetical protein
MHLLQCNVSNQYTGRDEDACNKPWRPIPAGRISPSAAFRLRCALPIICMAMSTLYGGRLLAVSAGTTLVTIMYDELALSSHWVGKNLISVANYLVLEAGTSMLIGEHLPSIWLVCSLTVIVPQAKTLGSTAWVSDRSSTRHASLRRRSTVPTFLTSSATVLRVVPPFQSCFPRARVHSSSLLSGHGRFTSLPLGRSVGYRR